MKQSRAALFDASAVALSGLCLIHCLALPLLASLLPLFGAWSRAEWVHAVFVGIAAPLTGYALIRANEAQRLPRVLWVLAIGGLGCLLLGAIQWPSEAASTPITVVGSLMLAATHLWNTARRRHVHPH